MNTTKTSREISEAIANSPHLQQLLWRGTFGLETERLRVDNLGHLALTPHPSELGNKSIHPYITTDFSESQLELVTPPLNSIEQSHGFLKTILNVVREHLPVSELLWPQSMPPILPENDEAIPIATFEGDNAGKTKYRARLAEIYGRGRQLISGSHFNFSFTSEFVSALAETLDKPFDLTKEQIYLKIIRNLMRDRWFLVGLLGRSPVAHDSLRLKSLDTDKMLKICCTCGVSIRCSKIGYRNRESFITDYCCLDQYTQDLDEWVRKGKLVNHSELYLPIRLKMEPDQKSISHLEFRLLDLDPFEETGVSLDALRLLHLFSVYSLINDEPDEFGPLDQKRGETLQNEVACCGFAIEPSCMTEGLTANDFRSMSKEETIGIENRLKAANISIPTDYTQSLDVFKKYIAYPNTHPANLLKQQIKEQGFISFHLDRARNQEQLLADKTYRFHASPDLELSTQLLLKAAIRRGIDFEILDSKSNFVELRKGSKREWVVQATKTSLDSYSHILAMENKKVTKLLLSQNGISTPKGADFDSPSDAKASWYQFRNRAIVIKPANTNFGIGITILKSNTDPAAFSQAIDLAFSEDHQILVESFIEGREYRFFLINEKVVAVLHRVPANVIGDGFHNIQELIETKNRDPLRGKAYKTPLERIQTGPTERAYLHTQGSSLETVPLKDQRVFLRENSNISTGGDSIDFTDRIHPSYSKIAANAARALKVSIVGLDLIAQDIEAPATQNNHAIIELNFNPAIHIHCHPYEGQSRSLQEQILTALGFE